MQLNVHIQKSCKVWYSVLCITVVTVIVFLTYLVDAFHHGGALWTLVMVANEAFWCTMHHFSYTPSYDSPITGSMLC